MDSEMWKITAMEPSHQMRASSCAFLLHRPGGLRGLIEFTDPTGTLARGQRGGKTGVTSGGSGQGV